MEPNIGVNDLTEAVLSEAEGFRSIKLTDGDNTRLKGAYRYLGGAHGYCFRFYGRQLRKLSGPSRSSSMQIHVIKPDDTR